MAASRRGRLAITLFIALAAVLGYASWRGWLPGVVDYSDIEAKQHR